MLYFRVLPFNFMGFRPYFGLAGGALAFMLLSLSTLFFQGKCGAFFFVPRFMLKKQFNYFFSKKDLKRYFANIKEIALEEDENEKKTKSGSKSRFSSFKSLMSSIGFGKKKKNQNQKSEGDQDNTPKEDLAMKQSAGKDDIEQGDDQDYQKFDSLNETGNQSVEHDIENQTLNQDKLDKVDVSGKSLPISPTKYTSFL